MRILQICHRIPYPAVDGGNIAMMNMALALLEAGHEVHQFALNTTKHFIDPSCLPDDLREKLHFTSVKIDTTIRRSGAFRNLFTNESYNVVRFYNDEVERSLEKTLHANTFDIVQLETLFTTPYINCIRKNSGAKIVLRAHNVEHIIWDRLADKERNIIRKRYLRMLASRLRKYELETLKLIDALVPITPVDENIFRKFHFKRPVLTTPMSIDIKEYLFDNKKTAAMNLFHLGSMDWMPNHEGVSWFLENCWTEIHRQHPQLNLYLAGRNFPQEIMDRNFPNTFCEGRIEDAQTYMSDKQIMIVPLLSGSGMRVKIVQGMALGKTIISTTIGAEGIPAEHGKNILIADTPQDFINVVGKCIDNEEWTRSIGNKARKFAIDHYSNASVGHQLGLFYNAIKKLA